MSWSPTGIPGENISHLSAFQAFETHYLSWSSAGILDKPFRFCCCFGRSVPTSTVFVDRLIFNSNVQGIVFALIVQ